MTVEAAYLRMLLVCGMPPSRLYRPSFRARLAQADAWRAWNAAASAQVVELLPICVGVSRGGFCSWCRRLEEEKA